MYGKVINKGGTPSHKERRPYFTFTKKYEKQTLFIETY